MSRVLLAALAAVALGPAALAQTMTLSPGTPSSASPGVTTFSPSTQEVQLLAPQLVPFAGSSGNFDSLVTGLTTGATVTLATAGANGSLQIVTFTPASSISPGDAARLLETARQNLISQGIAAPTSTQLVAALLGGTVTSLSGTTNTLTGVLTGTTSPPTPVQVRTNAGALQNGTLSSNISPAQLVAVRNALATGGGVTLTGSGGAPSVVFSATGARLSDAEVNQALQLAVTLLAAQGVLNPTADQLRVALFGGTLIAANGTAIALQGVLQGQLRNTSSSTAGITSGSPSTNTSNSSLTGTSNSSLTSTSNSSVSGTSNSSLFGTSNSPSAGTSNSAAAGTSNSSTAVTSSSALAGTSNSSVAGTSNSPLVTSPGASAAGGTTTAAPLATRGRR